MLKVSPGDAVVKGGIDAFISSRQREEKRGLLVRKISGKMMTHRSERRNALLGGGGAGGAGGAGGGGGGGGAGDGGGAAALDEDELALAARDSEDAAVLSRPADSEEECAALVSRAKEAFKEHQYRESAQSLLLSVGEASLTEWRARGVAWRGVAWRGLGGRHGAMPGRLGLAIFCRPHTGNSGCDAEGLGLPCVFAHAGGGDEARRLRLPT